MVENLSENCENTSSRHKARDVYMVITSDEFVFILLLIDKITESLKFFVKSSKLISRHLECYAISLFYEKFPSNFQRK